MAITPGGCYRQDHRLYYVRRPGSFGKAIAMTVLSDLKHTKKFLLVVSVQPEDDAESDDLRREEVRDGLDL